MKNILKKLSITSILFLNFVMLANSCFADVIDPGPKLLRNTIGSNIFENAENPAVIVIIFLVAILSGLVFYVVCRDHSGNGINENKTKKEPFIKVNISVGKNAENVQSSENVVNDENQNNNEKE